MLIMARRLKSSNSSFIGLAAFHLARRFPTPHITLIEKAPTIGGWVHSERVRVHDGGRDCEILLEGGPRTLRPGSKAVLELINLLNLSSSILTVSDTSPAARNRFLHLPGTHGLVHIPSSLPALLRSPLSRVLFPAVLKDLVTLHRNTLNVESSRDESVDAFLTRHFGPEFALKFGSALVHGIYAADSRVLSTRAALRWLLWRKAAGAARVTEKEPQEERYDLGHIEYLMKGVSVYSFKSGLQTLVDALLEDLEKRENVSVIKGDPVAKLSRTNDSRDFELETESGRTIVSSHLVSAMPLPALHELLQNSYRHPPSSHSTAHISSHSLPRSEDIVRPPLPPFPHPALAFRTHVPGRYYIPQLTRSTSTSTPVKTPSQQSTALPMLPHLLANPTSSVVVINLVFPLRHHRSTLRASAILSRARRLGLGILGTVFDSCALAGQDIQGSADADAPRFTKMTVMLGGPYPSPTPDPSSPMFLPALLKALSSHLGTPALPEPCLVRVRQHAHCIPTPTVGHVERMAELRAAVSQFWGKEAAVIGAGVGGVSVGDCVEAGRRVGLDW
ncbi:Protoporphyrinogen oxidase [Grifola frondosa]|uniref:Protoporphyrinogen oxidase n=1 Tax=Grifola frondosa TaxID=5627 RepID=A0A1C7LT49_GRIFR|nr:Protoporphyrinogen oxidase [Grifola frondosa]